MKVLNSILTIRNPGLNVDPVLSLNKDSFIKFRKKIMPHITTHYFLHNTYCRLSKKFCFISYINFRLKSLQILEPETKTNNGLICERHKWKTLYKYADDDYNICENCGICAIITYLDYDRNTKIVTYDELIVEINKLKERKLESTIS